MHDVSFFRRLARIEHVYVACSDAYSELTSKQTSYVGQNLSSDLKML